MKLALMGISFVVIGSLGLVLASQKEASECAYVLSDAEAGYNQAAFDECVDQDGEVVCE